VNTHRHIDTKTADQLQYVDHKNVLCTRNTLYHICDAVLQTLDLTL